MSTRDTDAIDALRTRLATITGLWPIVKHNDKASSASYDATQGYIVETPIGGPTRPKTIGTTVPIRERSRQWHLLLHAPVDSGLAHVTQAELIESGLQGSPITIGASDPDGPIALLIDDVSPRPPRPQTRAIAHITVPVVVSYRLYAA